jgi:hypothetical protein
VSKLQSSGGDPAKVEWSPWVVLCGKWGVRREWLREVLVRELQGEVMGLIGSSRGVWHAGHANKTEIADACV